MSPAAELPAAATTTTTSGSDDVASGRGGGGGPAAAGAGEGAEVVVVPAASATLADAGGGNNNRSNSLKRSPSQLSVYDLHSNRARYIMLGVVSFASLLVPLTDTIYLPALLSIQQAFSTSTELVAASVAIYMFTVGLSALLWGPASDRYGRRTVYLLASALFLGFTVACVFAPSIGTLIAFRALQGAAVAAYGATGSGVIADLFAPAQRGLALGISTIPLLLGPLLGPILGGALSQRFSWRATFVFVAALGAMVAAAVAFCLKETEQHRHLRRLVKRDASFAVDVEEAADILARRPRFAAPWVPILMLFERKIILHAAFVVCVFGSMFCSLTELPLYLSRPPYSLSTAVVGLCFIPGGVAGFFASPVGGRISDLAARAHPGHPMVRLLWNTLGAAIALPAGLIVFGWALERGASLALVLAAQFVIACSVSFLLPALFSYLTVVKQSAAAAAAAGVHSLMFVLSGVLILCAAAAGNAIGVGRFMTILAAANVALGAAAFGHAFQHRHESLSLSRAASRASLAAAAAANNSSSGGAAGAAAAASQEEEPARAAEEGRAATAAVVVGAGGGK